MQLGVTNETGAPGRGDKGLMTRLEWLCEQGLEGNRTETHAGTPARHRFPHLHLHRREQESQARGSHQERLSGQVSEEQAFLSYRLNKEVRLSLLFETGVAASDKE